MSRGSKTPVRELTPDAVYNSTVIEKFIRRMMIDGKKGISTKITYTAMETIAQKSGENALDVFNKALENVKPMVEVKSRRVGGATYQVPTEIREGRREALAMRWIIAAARARSGKSMAEKLAAELLDAYNSTGAAFKKKEDTHRMAEANKAFSHFSGRSKQGFQPFQMVVHPLQQYLAGSPSGLLFSCLTEFYFLLRFEIR